MVSLGDLDQDGYGDFVVGAPFEDNGQGTVRIYYGRFSIDSIQSATILRSPNSQGFGSSFSKKHLDVDGNGLQDLAIGSYLSTEAFVYPRLASVWTSITMEPSVSFLDIESEVKRKLDLFPSFLTQCTVSHVVGV